MKLTIKKQIKIYTVLFISFLGTFIGFMFADSRRIECIIISYKI